MSCVVCGKSKGYCTRVTWFRTTPHSGDASLTETLCLSCFAWVYLTTGKFGVLFMGAY